MGILSNLVVKIGADLSEFEKGMKGLSSNLMSAGKGLTMLSAPITALGAVAFAAGESFEQSFRKIRLGTGDTGVALQGLEESFKRIFTSLPVSAEQASTAITMLHQRTGETGTALEALATSVIRLAKYTGTDLQAAIPAVTRALKDWSVSTDKQGAALDFLFKLTQQTGIGLQSLTERVVQFGSPMRALGFSFEQASALIAQFEQQGVNLETAMPGLRLGLQKLAKEGVTNAADALQILMGRIKDAPNVMVAAQEAAAIFGKRAGTDLAMAIREGRFDVDALLKSVKDSKETLSGAAGDVATFASKFTVLKNQATAALEPIGKILVDALSGLMDKLKPCTEWIASLVDGFQKLSPETQKLIIAFGGAVAATGPAAIALAGVVKGVTSLSGALAPLAGALGTSTVALVGWAGAILAGVGAIAGIVIAVKDYLSAKEDLTKAEQGHRDALAKMEVMLHQQGVDITALQKQYDQGVISLTDYQKALSDLLQKHGAATKATEEQTKATKELGEVAKQTKSWLQMLAEEGESRYQQRLKKTVDTIYSWLEAARTWGQQLQTINSYVEQQIFTFDQLLEIYPELNNYQRQWANFLSTLPPLLTEHEQILKRLGITSHDALKAEADAAGDAYMALVRMKAPQDEINRAYDIWVEKEKTAAGMDTGWMTQRTSLWQQMGKEVSHAMESLSRGIADSIVNAKSLGDAFVNVAKDIAKAILTIAIGQGIKVLLQHLTGVLDKLGAIGKALEQWAGVGVSAAGGAASAAGGAASAAGSAAGAAGNAAGGAGSAAGGVAGAAGGIMGTIGAIGSVGSMVSGIIGNFQNAKMEKTLNAIEESTRYVKIVVCEGSDSLYLNVRTLRENFAQYLNVFTNSFMLTHQLILDNVRYQLNKMYDWDNGVFPAIRDGLKGAGAQITINISGAQSPTDTGNAVVNALRAQGAFA